MPNNKLKHIAVILDGNKRWALQNKVSIKKAYNAGLETINDLIKSSLNIKIPYLTLFTLSSENIKRKSVGNIYQVIYDDFSFFVEKIINEKLVKIKILGSKKNLPPKIIKLIEYCETETKNNNLLNLNLAFNYGFKDEIKHVLNEVIINKNINLEIDKNIKNLFYLGSDPDPDILIRTGGNKRLSNFIMYNLTYTEIFFIDTLWPDFNNQELVNIINIYEKTSRRYGL